MDTQRTFPCQADAPKSLMVEFMTLYCNISFKIRVFARATDWAKERLHLVHQEVTGSVLPASLFKVSDHKVLRRCLSLLFDIPAA